MDPSELQLILEKSFDSDDRLWQAFSKKTLEEQVAFVKSLLASEEQRRFYQPPPTPTERQLAIDRCGYHGSLYYSVNPYFNPTLTVACSPDTITFVYSNGEMTHAKMV